MARGAAPPLDPEALKDARHGARLSQAALARAAGTDRRQIIRYENGAERPEIARLAALARACGVQVVDLVDEEHLPLGLAGLRVSAGLTMAAAAAALGDLVAPATGIATNRASLSGAEKGRMPLSWQPPPARSRVRGAMAAAYEVDIDRVRAAWAATFGDAPREDESASGSINATSNEAASQTPPPPLAETAALVWGTDRPASQAWRIRARIRETDGSEVEAVATGIEGSPPVVGWWASHHGLSRTVYGEVAQALEWTSPWRSMPEAAPDLPGARPTPPPEGVELPFIDQAPSWMRELPDDTPAPAAPEAVAWSQWRPLSQWLWEHLLRIAAAGPAGADSTGQEEAHWQERLSEEPGRGYIAATGHRCWLTEAGREHILAHREEYAHMYPEADQPRAVLQMSAQTVLREESGPAGAEVEPPLDSTVDEPDLERVSGSDAPDLLTEEDRIYRVRVRGQILGWVWREEGGKEWGTLRADADGHPYEILVVAPRRDRRTRAQAVGLLRERCGQEGPSAAWGPIPRAHTAEPTSAPLPKTTTAEVDMSEKIGPGWTLRRQGPAEEHTWILMHQGQERGMVRRYRPRNTELSLHRGEVLSRGWEALAGDSQRRMRRSATDQGKFGQRSSFLWRSRDLAAWGIATTPAFAQSSPEWARRPRR